MEAKKIYESGKLHGVYRCGKREELVNKIPRIDKEGMPDVTGIVISGIMNFGNDADMIKAMAKDAIGCKAEDIKIPYDESQFARRRFINDVIVGKLTGSVRFITQALIDTFYEFLEMPTEATKQMQAKDDLRDIERYLNNETRRPIVLGHPIINLCGANFECQMDFAFLGPHIVKTNKHKEGRKWVYDEEEVYLAEAVRIFPNKPAVKETSKILDVGIGTRLELYVMIKEMQKWVDAHKCAGGQPILLRASYYYLKKDREDDKHYSDNFFDGKGGNVISLSVIYSEDTMKAIDDIYAPKLREFLEGNSALSGECKNCSSRMLCGYHDASIPLTEEERPKPKALPVLSPDQEKAANALEGNIRVIATAGSGKTTAMAYRIMNLLKAGVSPEKIGCFTFTNAGAGEMRDRIKGFCSIAGIDVDFDKITISTIHSFGDSLLKQYYNLLGYKKPPVLINEIQRTKIIEEILSKNSTIEELADKYKNFYLDMFRAKGILELMKGYFSDIMDGISQEDFQEKTRLENETVEAIYRMYMQYDKYKREACLIEHSDQELGVLRLLRLKPDLFDEVGIEHISVDEYQDTSNIQFKIINEMRKAKCVKSLFIVGDDDQSIYGFREANVELIKDFFVMIGDKNGTDVRLMENRRSTVNIVDFAAKLISFNEDRIDKKPVSTNGFGKHVEVEKCRTKDEEQEYIIRNVNTVRILAKKTKKGRENMKCELFNGVTYYTDGDVCTDIDVAPDIKSVALMHPIVNIARNTCKKEYPNVEELIIRDNVTSILIPNKMFPNVKKVSSKSKYFSSGKYLIKKFRGDNLLNAFGQSESEYINFGLFEGVTNYAFDGCKAKEICNYDDSKYMSFDIHAFDGSGFLKRPFIDGLKRLGSLVIDIDSDADEIVIPDEKLVFAVQKNVKCVRIKCINSFNPSRTLAEKVIIEDERLKVDDTIREKLRYYGIKEIESRIPRYKTADGIIYSADMTTLIACPQMKTGKVVIPEGVKRIRKGAFSGSKISGVVLPDSLEKIEAEAFYGCENLEDVDFGHGLERIGENGCKNIFAGCAISKLVLPPQIKKIGICAFYCCFKLTDLVLNEGLEEIGAGAFIYCKSLTQVALPESIKKIGKSAFIQHITQNGVYADINVYTSSIPKDFIFGFVKQGISSDAKTSICVHLKNQTENFKFVLPDAIRLNSDYSRINFALNNFANHPELSKKVLNEGFLMASNAKSVDITAYKTYKLTKGQRAKEFIRDNSDDIAFSFARMMPEKDFVDFIKLDFVKLKYSEKLAEQLRKNEWTTGIAYMLEATEADEKSERKNFVI